MYIRYLGCWTSMKRKASPFSPCFAAKKSLLFYLPGPKQLKIRVPDKNRFLTLKITPNCHSFVHIIVSNWLQRWRAPRRTPTGRPLRRRWPPRPRSLQRMQPTEAAARGSSFCCSKRSCSLTSWEPRTRQSRRWRWRRRRRGTPRPARPKRATIVTEWPNRRKMKNFWQVCCRRNFLAVQYLLF